MSWQRLWVAGGALLMKLGLGRLVVLDPGGKCIAPALVVVPSGTPCADTCPFCGHGDKNAATFNRAGTGTAAIFTFSRLVTGQTFLVRSGVTDLGSMPLQ